MTFAVYLRLGLHVSASNIDVIRACRTKIAEHHLWCREMKELRKQSTITDRLVQSINWQRSDERDSVPHRTARRNLATVETVALSFERHRAIMAASTQRRPP